MGWLGFAGAWYEGSSTYLLALGMLSGRCCIQVVVGCGWRSNVASFLCLVPRCSSSWSPSFLVVPHHSVASSKVLYGRCLALQGRRWKPPGVLKERPSDGIRVHFIAQGQSRCRPWIRTMARRLSGWSSTQRRKGLMAVLFGVYLLQIK